MNSMQGKRVFVGLSGGVDSSVSASLLSDQGFDVSGVFIKTWYPDFIECDWKKERRDAMKVCAHLGIPFIELDLEQEYKDLVADYMINEYRKGRTPNPDVMCNKNIKFGGFLRWAKEQGADFVATGHYAQVEHGTTHTLSAGTDTNKDQSYFLWTLTQDQLKHILFPIGHLTKPEVRALAEKKGLVTATKKDSQGICFLGHVDMHDFLGHYIDTQEGSVLNENGDVIGRHKGALLYTIGQRHGFTVQKKSPESGPFYVLSKDIESNTLVVTEQKGKEDALYNTCEIVLGETNWIREVQEGVKYTARIRYRQPLQACSLFRKEDGWHVVFDEAQKAVACGQSCVVYEEGRCLGGGIIELTHRF